MRRIPGKYGGTLIVPEKGEQIPGPRYPKGVPNSATRLKKLLKIVIERPNDKGEMEKHSIAEWMDMAIANQAMEGNVNAWEKLLDRFEGKTKLNDETPPATLNQQINIYIDGTKLDGSK